MLRIAVLGCGRIGQMHAANVAKHPRAELVTVYDVNQAAAETVAKALGVTAPFRRQWFSPRRMSMRC